MTGGPCQSGIGWHQRWGHIIYCKNYSTITHKGYPFVPSA